MNLQASSRGNFIPLSSQCSSSRCDLRFFPLIASSVAARQKWRNFRPNHVSSVRLAFYGKRAVVCRMTETETEPESNDEKEKGVHEDEELTTSAESVSPVIDQNEDQFGAGGLIPASQLMEWAETKAQSGSEDRDNVEVASGSPLPGVKPQKLDESIRIPKETIDILRDQLFGFDTFFVTSQEPYEDKFGDQFKLFLLINPENDKPVAFVVPRKTLQPETTAVPEWFAAGAFRLITVFIVECAFLQSNSLSTFDNLDLLKDGLPGALVTALILVVHEISQILVAKDAGVKLGVPYFVPSWQQSFFWVMFSRKGLQYLSTPS